MEMRMEEWKFKVHILYMYIPCNSTLRVVFNKSLTDRTSAMEMKDFQKLVTKDMDTCRKLLLKK